MQNISETVRDRDLVPKDHQQEMTYGESNGHVTDLLQKAHPCVTLNDQACDFNIVRVLCLEKGRR